MHAIILLFGIRINIIIVALFITIIIINITIIMYFIALFFIINNIINNKYKFFLNNNITFSCVFKNSSVLIFFFKLQFSFIL